MMCMRVCYLCALINVNMLGFFVHKLVGEVSHV